MLSSFGDSFWAGRRTVSGVITPVVIPGLVMWVDAAQPVCYSDSTSTVWVDYTANGNDLSLQNTENITWNGKYFNLGASGLDNELYGYFDRTVGNNVPQGDDPYCMGVWARQPYYWNQAGGFISIGADDPVSANGGNRLRIDQGIVGQFKHEWYENGPLGGGIDGTSNRVRINRWFLVMAQYDGTTRSIWANGIKIAEDTPAASSHVVTDPKIQVSKGDVYGYNQQGDIAQAFIYDRALTSQEIRRIFNSYRGRFGA